MKTCKRCQKINPLTEFYVHKMMADGYLNFCKACTRKRVAVHREKNLENYRAYDRARGKQPDRIAHIREKNKRKRVHMGPAFNRAHNAVNRAVARGTLVRPSMCECCELPDDRSPRRRVSAHHDDYDQPLQVMWLCPTCHARRHVELGRIFVAGNK